jgi:hypothetical protein
MSTNAIRKALPIHPTTGLRALGLRRNGAPIWPVAGASPDDQSDDDSGAADDEDEPDDDEGKDDLGDAGKQALDRMKAARNAERERRKALEQELAALKSKKSAADDDKPDVEALREQAKAEARAEALHERVADKIEAKAGARFNLDPEDVAALLLRRHDIDDFIDDGKVDTEAIAEALDDLLAKKPALAAGSGDDSKRKRGDVDQGHRGDARPKQLSRDDLKRMSPKEIEKARKEGRLDDLLAGKKT